jgi:hypothetical protein
MRAPLRQLIRRARGSRGLGRKLRGGRAGGEAAQTIRRLRPRVVASRAGFVFCSSSPLTAIAAHPLRRGRLLLPASLGLGSDVLELAMISPARRAKAS